MENFPRASDNAETPQQGHRVFEVPELLESILSYLPPRDLIRLQRSCLGFQSLIATSPTLQRNLFLKATTPPTDPATIAKHKTTQMNPLLFAPPSPFIYQHKPHLHSSLIPLIIAKRNRAESCSSSQDQMFLSQPPATEVRVVACLKKTGPRARALKMTHTNSDGIRCGELLPAIRGRYARTAEYYALRSRVVGIVWNTVDAVEMLGDEQASEGVGVLKQVGDEAEALRKQASDVLLLFRPSNGADCVFESATREERPGRRERGRV